MDRIMTRRATARLEESKLQAALVELKKYKDLCEELQREQDDNEREVLNILNNNTKLKSEMAELHNQLIHITEERDKLQHTVETFDQCGDVFDTTIKHNAELKCRLSEAQDTITRMESTSQRLQTSQTHALFEELVGATPLHSVNPILSNKNSLVETIDLTHNNSVTSSPQVRLIKCSNNKFKKYIKINKIIKKTQKLIKNNKNSYSKTCKSLRSCKLLKEKISNHNIIVNKIQNNCEAEIQQSQSEILHLRDSLNLLTAKYEISQKEMGEYILAMNSLVEQCSENERMFNSLTNNLTPDCNHDSSSCSRSAILHESIPSETQSVELFDSLISTSLATQKSQNSEINVNNNDQIFMYCDEMGKNMGHVLHHHLDKQVINCCMPDASYCGILEKVLSKEYSPSTTILILIGRRGNANIAKIKKYFDSLAMLNVHKIVLFAFPYGNGLSQTENNIRYRHNMKINTMTMYNKKFEFIDSNVLISQKYFTTEDNYYLCNFYKGQVAKSLSYCINKSAKCLANYTASIEQLSHTLYLNNQSLEFVPSNLNYNMGQ